MKVLVACEFSGTVRDAFALRGHDAWSCDLLPSETPGNHYQGDVLQHLHKSWDLIIAHPPCTYITNAGVRHLHSVESRNGVLPKVHGKQRWNEMEKAVEFFNEFFDAAPQVCIENPIPHRYAVAQMKYGKYQQLVQPWMFGHMEAKATCLWLQNLPKLVETNNVKQQMLKLPKKERNRIHYMSPSKDRAKERSKTFQGIADAMASQWG